MVCFSFFGFSGCASHHHRLEHNAVHLYLVKPYAKTVRFVHSTDGYKLHEAQKTDTWTWDVKVPAQGDFKYFYLVDGRPFLPDCKLRERDDFGAENCIYSQEM